jgi:hypothetical protein
MSSPHPRIRFASALLAEASIFLTHQLGVLTGAAVALSLLMLWMHSWRRYRVLLRVFVGLALALCLLWGVVIRAAPGQPIGSDPVSGLRHAALTVLRLFCASVVAHIAILGIPTKDLPKSLAACGVHGGLLVAVLGAIALVPEAELRTSQVLTARYARGLSKGRTFWGLATHLPATFRPVLAWTLRSALSRSEMWSQRGLVERLERPDSVLVWSMGGNIQWLTPALLWLSYGIRSQFMR